MNIAIVGSSGYIGRYLYGKLSQFEYIDILWRIGREKGVDYVLDLANAEKFDYSVLKPIDYIIFTAAISSPDNCEKEYAKCWKVNVDGTCFFIHKALNMRCKVLFFSSDAVYGNIPGYIYSEDAETRAETDYGRMKKVVEDEFMNETFFKAMRLSYVVSAKDRFVSYCLECVKDKITAEVFHPFYRNCITISDVGNMVIWLIKYWNEFPHTFLNGAGGELVSRVRIADEINRITNGGLRFRIVVPDKSFYFNRPEITQMESLYLYRYNIIAQKSFTRRLQSELEGYVNASKN